MSSGPVANCIGVEIDLVHANQRVGWIVKSKPLLFVLAILAAGFLGVGAIGVVKSNALLAVAVGMEALIAATLLAICCRSTEQIEPTPLLNSDQIVLENNGKRVMTSIEELYRIAEEGTFANDREAFLKEVETRLNDKDFQSNPLLYVEQWIQHRGRNTSLQMEALEFFCYLLRKVDDSHFPWANRPNASLT